MKLEILEYKVVETKREKKNIPTYLQFYHIYIFIYRERKRDKDDIVILGYGQLHPHHTTHMHVQEDSFLSLLHFDEAPPSTRLSGEETIGVVT